MTASDWIQQLLREQHHSLALTSSSAFCPSNIALIKYWGKRDLEFNLPTHSSISISLADKGALCAIEPADKDAIIVNDVELEQTSPHFLRLQKFINLITAHDRPQLNISFTVNIPIAAGLASSACIFAALTQAISKLYAWNLNDKQLSCLARLGSGSAARSIYNGFVIWHCGTKVDGSDSYAEKIPTVWPEFRIGLLINSTAKKAISSTHAMQQTTATSDLFAQYSEYSEQNQLPAMLDAIKKKDFTKLGSIAENNAIQMHATMHSASPSINFDNESTQKHKQMVIDARAAGIEVYFTQDAGPNLKLLFLDTATSKVLDMFPDCDIVAPCKENT